MKEFFDVGIGENKVQTQELMTLSFAEGTVDPTDRIRKGEIDEAKVHELAGRIQNGEYSTFGDPEAIPCNCMDCRHQENGEPVIGPKAAAGSFTPVVADALTTDSYRHPGEKAPAHKRRLWMELMKLGHRPGGHIPAGDSPGCGAEFKLDAQNQDPSILEFLGRKSADIFGLMRSLGYQVTADLEDSIVSKSQALRTEGYATNGQDLAAVGAEVVGTRNLAKLPGPQKGVLVAIITTPGEYLDQDRILQDYGPEYPVFEVEAWAIENGARATSLTEEEQIAKNVAGTAYNLAAGGVIAGPGMPVVVR